MTGGDDLYRVHPGPDEELKLDLAMGRMSQEDYAGMTGIGTGLKMPVETVTKDNGTHT